MHTTILETPPQKAFRDFLHLCSMIEGIDVRLTADIARTTIRYLHANAQERARLRLNQSIEQRWYSALAQGTPDYGVYDADGYLGDLWACWAVYSRRYLLGIRSNKTAEGRVIIDDIGSVQSVVDLGCGMGYTTAALRILFPVASITATNFDDIAQTRMARVLGRNYGFTVVPDIHRIHGSVDLVFASEYFEHIYAPIEHLIDVLTHLRPRVLLVANTFGTRSIGHFDRYVIDGSLHDGKATSRAFGATMRRFGYHQVKTSLWNNRPAYWKRDPKRSEAGTQSSEE